MGLDQFLDKVNKGVYWRKSNQIHAWIDRRLRQKANEYGETFEGIEDCEYYNLSQKDIEDLLSDVNLVLKDHTKAEEILPTQEGFFFGPCEYDEYYFEDLEYTQENLEELLQNAEEMESYRYYAWW